jgi:hypothetical protein
MTVSVPRRPALQPVHGRSRFVRSKPFFFLSWQFPFDFMVGTSSKHRHSTKDKRDIPMDQEDIERILDDMRAKPESAMEAAFIFGIRVAEALNGIGISRTSPHETFSLLVRIASGTETLVSSGAEIRGRSPNAPEDIEEIRHDNQRFEQAIAHLLVSRNRSE